MNQTIDHIIKENKKTDNKIAITACSNPMKPSFQNDMDRLCSILEAMGLVPILSDYIYDNGTGFSGTGKERADALMTFYKDSDIMAICDISGGDMANEILPYLDFEGIAANPKPFFGYSDLTTIINAITTMTGHESVLYQIRNVLYNHGQEQIANLRKLFKENDEALYDFDYSFVQGNALEGVLIGGNIRCFLKLAGTKYMPDFHNKILLLEAYSGGTAQMITFLSQLKMMGAFEQINGILLGTFTKMEEAFAQSEDGGQESDIVELVKRIAGKELPIAKTQFIGHGTNSKAAVIGRYYQLKENID